MCLQWEAAQPGRGRGELLERTLKIVEGFLKFIFFNDLQAGKRDADER